MSDGAVVITREELYRRIWSTPATRLAKEYGISDVALGKICRKLEVPKPYPGYWAKIEFGVTIEPTPLPKAKKETPSLVTIYPSPSNDPFHLQNLEVLVRIESEKEPDNRVMVAEDLRGAHPLVSQTGQALKRLRSRDEGVRLDALRQPRLDVRVSRDLLDRALRIYDALLKALETRGNSVELSGEGQETRAVIGEEKVKVFIFEKDDRNPRELTAEEKKKPPHMISDRWLYTPSGKLTFTIDESWEGCQRKNWADKKGKPLEEQLNDVIVGILNAAEGLRLQRLRREEWQRKWREEEQLRQEAQWRQKMFETQADKWVRSRNMRAFLKACEGFVAEDSLRDVSTNLSAEWLLWAERYADWLDPLKNGEFEKMLRQLNGEHGYY